MTITTETAKIEYNGANGWVATIGNGTIKCYPNRAGTQIVCGDKIIADCGADAIAAEIAQYEQAKRAAKTVASQPVLQAYAHRYSGTALGFDGRGNRVKDGPEWKWGR